MNIENLAIENQETQLSANITGEATTEVTPLPVEFLMLVGGGGAIVND